MFASLTKQAAPTSLFAGGSTNQTGTSSLLGQPSTNTTATPSLFGQPAAHTTPAPSLFGQSLSNTTAGSGFFGQPQQQAQPQQHQQQTPLGSSLGLGQSQNANAASGLLWQSHGQMAESKPVLQQLEDVVRKWDPAPQNKTCAFRTYLYNKVDEHHVPLYNPGPDDDSHQWEEALQNKPAPNYIPVLASGFPALQQRLVLQRRVIIEFNRKLHEINGCLDLILSRHDVDHSERARQARRRHDALTKRCLALAARVQVMRNQGYQLTGEEDELRKKLLRLERSLQDPAIGARMEELWSRLIVLREYADNLQTEINKHGLQDAEGLDPEVEAKAKKILEDYEKQLLYLKKEVGQIKKDFEEWEKDCQPAPAPRTPTR